MKHTSELIKNNFATILTEFPQDYIRPCNKSEIPVKPVEISINHWYKLICSEERVSDDSLTRHITEEDWKSLTYQQKSEISTNKNKHRRADHNYAHICVSHIKSKKLLKSGKTWNTYEERFFYVTNSTFFSKDDNGDITPWISFRRELIEDWRDIGFCDIIWFVKNTNKYVIATADEVQRSYKRHNCSGDNKIVGFKTGSYEYIAFPLDVELKTTATDMPSNTLFVPTEENLKTFDYIENIQYKHSTRNYKGIIYCAIKDPNGDIKETKFNSMSEAYKKLCAHYYTFGYSEKTFRRRVCAGELQLLDQNFYEDYECLLSYKEDDIERYKKDPDSFKKVTKKETSVNGIKIEKTETETMINYNPLVDLVLEKIDSDDDKHSSFESADDTNIDISSEDLTKENIVDPNEKIDLNKLFASDENMKDFLVPDEKFRHRAELTYEQNRTCSTERQYKPLF
jgi:hypothetical protein